MTKRDNPTAALRLAEKMKRDARRLRSDYKASRTVSLRSARRAERFSHTAFA
jgi:hypothetical protein